MDDTNLELNLILVSLSTRNKNKDTQVPLSLHNHHSCTKMHFLKMFFFIIDVKASRKYKNGALNKEAINNRNSVKSQSTQVITKKVMPEEIYFYDIYQTLLRRQQCKQSFI